MRLIFLYISVLHVLQKPLEALLAHTYTTNMKIVGHANRHEIELNPQEAWRRARLMDAATQCLVSVPHPLSRLFAALQSDTLENNCRRPLLLVAGDIRDCTQFGSAKDKRYSLGGKTHAS